MIDQWRLMIDELLLARQSYCHAVGAAVVLLHPSLARREPA